MFTSLVLSLLLANSPPTAVVSVSFRKPDAFYTHPVMTNYAKNLVRFFPPTIRERMNYPDDKRIVQHIRVSAFGNRMLLIWSDGLPSDEGARLANEFAAYVPEGQRRSEQLVGVEIAALEACLRDHKAVLAQVEKELWNQIAEVRRLRVDPAAEDTLVRGAEQTLTNYSRNCSREEESVIRVELELERLKREPGYYGARVLKWAETSNVKRPVLP